MPIMTVSATVFYRVAPYMPILDGVPTNFALEALEQHADAVVWMHVFDHPENYTHAEHTGGILRTLATILTTRNVTRMLSGVRCEKHSPHSV